MSKEIEQEEDAWEDKHCPNCNLDFKGISIDSVCPECETEFKVEQNKCQWCSNPITAGFLCPLCPSKEIEQNWEEEFDKEFNWLNWATPNKNGIHSLHNFIRHQKQLSYKEALELVVENIRKAPLPNEYDKQTANDLIDYIITIINNLKR